MVKENSQLFILVFLGMLTAFGPFVTDMYLPTLPAMTGFFQTTSSQVQLGLTASMIGLAVGQLLFGPLSDKYGRRIPLIMAMLLFLFSTLGCLFSATIMQFVGWRLVQGIAGAGGIVISRSIAADKYSGRELAKMLAVIGSSVCQYLFGTFHHAGTLWLFTADVQCLFWNQCAGHCHFRSLFRPFFSSGAGPVPGKFRHGCRFAVALSGPLFGLQFLGL